MEFPASTENEKDATVNQNYREKKYDDVPSFAWHMQK